MLGLVGQEVHQSNSGWSPVFAGDLAVMSIGFLLGNQNDAVIWRGPRKNGLIQQFLQEVDWGELDFLIIDSIFVLSQHPLGHRTSIYPSHSSSGAAPTTEQLW